MPYVILLAAIAIEVGASLALKLSAGLSRPLPAVVALLGFGLSLLLLARVSAQLPLSLTYPTWAGLGVVGATLGAAALFGERVTPQHWAGIATVVLGVALIHMPLRSAGGEP